MDGLAKFYEAWDAAQEAHHRSYMGHLDYWRVPADADLTDAVYREPPKVVPKPTGWQFTPPAWRDLLVSTRPEDMWSTVTPRLYEDGKEVPATLFGLPIEIIRDLPEPGWRLVSGAK